MHRAGPRLLGCALHPCWHLRRLVFHASATHSSRQVCGQEPARRTFWQRCHHIGAWRFRGEASLVVSNLARCPREAAGSEAPALPTGSRRSQRRRASGVCAPPTAGHKQCNHKPWHNAGSFSLSSLRVGSPCAPESRLCLGMVLPTATPPLPPLASSYPCQAPILHGASMCDAPLPDRLGFIFRWRSAAPDSRFRAPIGLQPPSGSAWRSATPPTLGRIAIIMCSA